MKDRYTRPLLLLVFIILAADIVVAGCLIYCSQRNGCRTEAEQTRAVVTDLKVRNIVDWREERLTTLASLGRPTQLFSRLLKDA
jgi:hypothetical protein